MQTAESADMHQTKGSRPVIADVTASQVGGRIQFDLTWRKEGDPNGKKGPIVIEKGAPETPIHFHLHDDTGLKLSFKPEATEAMWVNTSGCPPQGPGNGGGQISFDSSSNRLLKVSDGNSGAACTLYYMLRFDGDRHVDPDGKSYPPYEYDPEIRNGGGE